MKAKNILGKAAANLALTNAKHAANLAWFTFIGQKNSSDNIRKLRNIYC